ncbi:MAG: formylglycine-generating enzyme family protein [Deltaproteobacteria bacterium]|nr:formylglycine-generating enzyme family protein [Deltaproteobacteria bacterium]
MLHRFFMGVLIVSLPLLSLSCKLLAGYESARHDTSLIHKDGSLADGPSHDTEADGRPMPDVMLDQDTPQDAPPLSDMTVDRGTPQDAPPPSDTGNTVMPAVWRDIPAGSFTMGSPANEACRDSTEETQYSVTLSNAFEMQSTEVTQAEFTALMGYNPSWYSANGRGADCGLDCPVEHVNWYQAAAYCNALSTKNQHEPCYECSGSQSAVSCDVKATLAGSRIYGCKGYRLPTEAEWEYAYRAGTTTAYYSGVNDGNLCLDCSSIDANLDSIAWYCGNAKGTSHPVAKKSKNAWGLYDLGGNVWEWCHDWRDSYPSTSVTNPAGSSTGTFRVVRGGSFSSGLLYTRAAARHHSQPTNGFSVNGFRCVRSLGP